MKTFEQQIKEEYQKQRNLLIRALDAMSEDENQTFDVFLNVSEMLGSLWMLAHLLTVIWGDNRFEKQAKDFEKQGRKAINDAAQKRGISSPQGRAD